MRNFKKKKIDESSLSLTDYICQRTFFIEKGHLIISGWISEENLGSLLFYLFGKENITVSLTKPILAWLNIPTQRVKQDPFIK
jgi:hypothetical protein